MNIPVYACTWLSDSTMANISDLILRKEFLAYSYCICMLQEMHYKPNRAFKKKQTFPASNNKPNDHLSPAQRPNFFLLQLIVC